jgi:hypothetical protein
MQHMTQTRGEMANEMSTHDAAMGQSIDVAAARLECERHAAAMGQMLDGMDGALSDPHCGM